MGTLLYGAIQMHFKADGVFRDHYQTIATFEFGKNYELSMRLEDLAIHVRPDEWFPTESDDQCRYQSFSPADLPKGDFGSTYMAFRTAIDSLKEELRILFWRDQ